MDKAPSTRQLKVSRELQRDLETPIARSIVAGKYPPGSTVKITAKNGSLVEAAS